MTTFFSTADRYFSAETAGGFAHSGACDTLGYELFQVENRYICHIDPPLTAPDLVRCGYGSTVHDNIFVVGYQTKSGRKTDVGSATWALAGAKR
jgi:hypothetical protein